MELDLEQVWANARRSSTVDLLDRVTIYREGMETEALAIIEAELNSRGVDWKQIAAYEEFRKADCLRSSDGTPLQCSRCRQPAVVRRQTWRYLLRFLPFVRLNRLFCREHDPEQED